MCDRDCWVPRDIMCMYVNDIVHVHVSGCDGKWIESILCNVSQNTHSRIHTDAYICLLTNLTELQLANIQVNYWQGQMHCGQPN